MNSKQRKISTPTYQLISQTIWLNQAKVRQPKLYQQRQAARRAKARIPRRRQQPPPVRRNSSFLLNSVAAGRAAVLIIVGAPSTSVPSIPTMIRPGPNFVEVTRTSVHSPIIMTAPTGEEAEIGPECLDIGAKSAVGDRRMSGQGEALITRMISAADALIWTRS